MCENPLTKIKKLKEFKRFKKFKKACAQQIQTAHPIAIISPNHQKPTKGGYWEPP